MTVHPTVHPGAVMAYRALDAIHLNPEQHDQAQWEVITPCGTTRCFAGWINYLAGRPACNWYGLTAEQQLAQGVPPELVGLSYVLVAGLIESVPQSLSAREVLHLDRWHNVDFFESHATLEDIEDEVLDIFGPRPAGMGAAPVLVGERRRVE